MKHVVSLFDIHNELNEIIEYMLDDEQLYIDYVESGTEFYLYIYNLLLEFDQERFIMSMNNKLRILTQSLKTNHITNLRLSRVYKQFYLIIDNLIPHNKDLDLKVIDYKIMNDYRINIVLEESIKYENYNINKYY